MSAHARLSGLLLVGTACLMLSGAAFAADAAAQPNDNLNATLWNQTSVEFQANALGAYALGRMRLDEALANKNWTALPSQKTDYQNLPPAVILDVDDTIVNTSAYQAWNVTAGTSFSPKSWTQYVKAKKDVPIPGAVGFTKYAASKGVTVFYVTNRSAEEKPATIEEMKAMGFPFSDKVDTFLAAKERPDWGSAKGTRFNFIAQKYRVLLLFGDNFGDFTDNYKGTPAERQKEFDADISHWGHDWIALANPMYGSFESAPYQANYKLPANEQRALKEQALKPWDGK
ncbi:5-nucleotide phosphatase [Allorhizobium sp. BGMRC 0089]|uniref:5'-nucleotidase, lipoprotein e(P4) family n=1 Tax=Allorhizobium sonneratiae TaxID=2934936 RepID=UPI0020348EC4|nr:HAD family acid phosphatase [Allorhizobium sonneratiae]MCM2293186.1 5-nucleotide phosphatase [Allorhizobium sonneratiae]